MKNTKTYSSERKIALNEDIVILLSTFKEPQKHLFEQFDVINPLIQILFLYIQGIVLKNAVNQSLRQSLKRLNISAIITMHGARHT